MNTPQNGTIWVDGTLADWNAAKIPLMSDALLRSLCAFDGLIAKRQPDGSLALVAPDRHYERLTRTCRVLGLPIELSRSTIFDGLREVALHETIGHAEADVYVRPMIVGAALTTRVRTASVTIAAFRQEATAQSPVSLKTSVWRRPDDDSMPAAIKVTGNYQLSRLARREATRLGYSDALILNSAGRVAESAGAAVILERGGSLLTPPAWDQCLDSVTVALIEVIAKTAGVRFSREPILFTQALTAEGMALAGTLADLTSVERLDDTSFTDSASALGTIRQAYESACRGGKWFDLLESITL